MSADKKGIKSSYELALERLGTESDRPALSDEMKRDLAQVDVETQAKTAEQEILFKARIAASLAADNIEEAVKLRDELATELRRIRERGEEKKEEIRRRQSGGKDE
jgi:hypothetical protein